MSWMLIPTALKVAPAPAMVSPWGLVSGGPIWTNGTLYRFQVNSDSYRYRISAQLAPTVRLTQSGSTWATLSPQLSEVNGYLWFSGGNPGVNLYFIPGGPWVLTNAANIPPGGVPHAAYNSTTQRYSGDSWYQGAAENGGTLSPKGEYLNNSPGALTVALDWDYWQSGTAFGVYSPQGSATGSKVFGCPRWRGDINGRRHTYFTRSISTTGGAYQYASSSNTELLTRVAVSGRYVWRWTSTNGKTYQGDSGPSESEPVNFYPLADGVPDTTAAALVLTFYDYVQGAETTDVMVGDVCRYL